MMRASLLLSSLVAACSDDDPERRPRSRGPEEEPTGPVDADEDGFDTTTDCDDADPEVNPAREEVACNGRDDDCDGARLPRSCEVAEADAAWSFSAPSRTVWSIVPDLTGDGRQDLQGDQGLDFPGELEARWFDGRDPGGGWEGEALWSVTVPWDEYDVFRGGRLAEVDGEPGLEAWVGRFLLPAGTGEMTEADAVASVVYSTEEGVWWSMRYTHDVDGDGLDDLVFFAYPSGGGRADTRALLAPFSGEIVVSRGSTVPVEGLSDPDGDHIVVGDDVTFTDVSLEPWCAEGGAAVLGDYTGDGTLDLGCMQGANLLVFHGPFPDRRATDPVAVWADVPGAILPAMGDTDGDGRDDLVVMSDTLAWAIPGGAYGRFDDAAAGTPWTLTVGGYGTGLEVGDLDGAGGPDLVRWSSAGRGEPVTAFFNVGF